MGAGYHGGFGKTNGNKTHQKNLETTKKSSNSLIDKNIISEMERNKIKFTKDDLIFTTKDKTGQLIFLEKGNSSVGLKHIEQRHTKDFVEKHKIQASQVSNHIYSVLTQGDLEYSRATIKKGKEGFERLYKYKGKYYLLSGVGINGFVVSAYPLDNKTAQQHIRRYKNERKN